MKCDASALKKSATSFKFQALQAVEGFSAGLLACEATPETFAKLREIIATQESGGPKTHADYYNANRIIHRAFVEATENPFLLDNFDAVWNLTTAVQMFETLNQPELEASLTGHSELCDAIVTGDFESAQRVMHKHIKDGRDTQLTAL